MSTDLQNLQQQVKSLEENTELITKDIVQIMPKIISIISNNEKNIKDFHEMRAKDVEALAQIQTFIKRENSILSKVIRDYGSLQNIATHVIDLTRQELKKMVDKEKEIVSKIASIPSEVNVRYHYGFDLKSTPMIVAMIITLVTISLGLGITYEKSSQLEDRKSYEMRYRRIELDLPKVTGKIDSIYYHNPDKFNALVIKREEEHKLLRSMDIKRREIDDLNKDLP